jgi:hypothetical protein
MSTGDPNPLAPAEHFLRLLRPFFFERQAVAAAVANLTQAKQPGRGRDWPLWEEARPHDLYLQETLEHVAQFLFGCDEGACRYLRVPAETANYWFKKGGGFRDPRAETERDQAARPDKQDTAPDKNEAAFPNGGVAKLKKPPSEFAVTLAAPGIEIFLSPHGVGVLSITFEAQAIVGEELALRELSYRLSQVREYSAYPFHLPYKPEHQTPPAPDAPLQQRFGVPGGAFTLSELTDCLVAPLGSLEHCWMQNQCSVYSVTQFGRTACFITPPVQESLRPLLTALAHVEEHHHVGSLSITEQVLNPCHWAAVGSLGAAHLVADQDPPHPFDRQRVPTVLYKYFIPYLLSLLQRLTLQRALGLARGQIVGPAAARPEDTRLAALHDLHSYMLGFNVNGYYTEVSSREALNQYYELAQRGLRVPQGLQLVQRTLRDAEAAAENRFEQRAAQELATLAAEVGENVTVVAHVQSKVEWLEVFFVSYYATALVYYVTAKELFAQAYAAWSVILTPLISGLIAFFGLQPHRLHRSKVKQADAANSRSEEEAARGRTPVILIGLILIFMVWLAAGYFLFPSQGTEAPEPPHASVAPLTTSPLSPTAAAPDRGAR